MSKTLIEPDNEMVIRRGSKQIRNKPNESYENLAYPIRQLVAMLPGISTRDIKATLNANGYYDWMRRGCNPDGIVRSVMSRMQKAKIIACACRGWYTYASIDPQMMGEHATQQGKRGLRTAINVVDECHEQRAVEMIDTKVRNATEAARNELA